MTGNQYFAHRYRETAIKTANPLQLVIMLYDAAICCIQEAREHIERKDIAGRSKSINKCISVITEMQSCLDRNAGGEIASSLDRLYDYMKRNIFRANVEQNPHLLVEVEGLLENLRSAWHQVVAQNPSAPVHYPTGPGLPNAGAMQPPIPADPMPVKPFSISA